VRKDFRLKFQSNYWFRIAVLVIICWISGFGGWTMGFVSATGTLPFVTEEQSVLPEPIAPVVSTVELEEFIKDDETNLQEYDVGFNCVEYAFLLARNAHWAGMPAEVIKVEFTNGEEHMILAFPTTDKGWQFIDPKSELFVKPRIGGMMGDLEISGLYILQAEWVPFEEVVE